MSPLREVSIIVVRELRKNFRSVKGLLLLVFTVLGGGLLAYLLAQSDDVRKRQFDVKHISAETVLAAKREGLSWWFTSAETGNHVGSAPLLLMFLFAVSLWLVPAVVLILGFDSVSGDLQHRTLRYWTVRTRRPSYVAGKFLALWATCGIVALAMHMLIWVIVIARGEATFAETLSWGIRFWLASLPILSVWCGLSVLVSTFFRLPILALLLTGGAFFLWWLVNVPFWAGPHLDALARTNPSAPDATSSLMVPHASAPMFLYPNFYDRFLLSPLFSQTMIGLLVTLGFAALCVAGGSFIIAKRDV